MARATPQTFGSYLVYEQIGKGGMASVHLAEQVAKDGTRRRVALKRLLPRAALDRDLIDSFEQEGKLLRYLDHPNIAATYDIGKIQATYFIAMEYVPGPTLKDLVEQCASTVNKVPNQITLNIAYQIAEALDHAHHMRDEHGRPLGIIHRDISPQNIILSTDGVAKLIDFGLAKTKVNKVSEDTGEGMIKGKFAYVAPEYLGGKLDARADLWALGVVMYELLTSRRLFDAPDNFETMTRVKKLPIPRPSRANPKVSRALDDIVMRALERDPARRWQDAAALRDALRAEIAKPGNAFDNKQVNNWVEWVFQQAPGGKEASAVANLFAPVEDLHAGGGHGPSRPRLEPPQPAAAEISVKSGGGTWIFVTLAVAVVAAVVWLLVF
jgi:eukaryotic-like serine/threonine-protein kinase